MLAHDDFWNRSKAKKQRKIAKTDFKKTNEPEKKPEQKQKGQRRKAS